VSVAGVNNKNKKCKHYDVTIQGGHNKTPTVYSGGFIFQL